MQTSVIGYPRVGASRELKFATEQYFRGEIGENELKQTAQHIRITQWKRQRDAGIDLIPSNDFSFYDNVLDTAVLFHIIPQRYAQLSLSPLAQYFAMARGYQGSAGDVKAFAMKKWFDTNYHYMVPEISDDTEIALVGTKPFDEFLEAKTCGITTKPVIIGPFTLLKLLTYTGEKRAEQFARPLAQAYAQYLARFSQLGAEWVQFDEPYLVHDLTEPDLTLFDELYHILLADKGNTRVLLQTYFGDVRDCYTHITALDFDGIGLDFIQGEQTAALIQKYGFPSDKLLFAGLINGRNIWRNHYEKTLAVIHALESNNISVILGTSCSLLHVPYTLKNETQLPETYIRHFAFAEEKLDELAQLQTIINTGSTEFLRANTALFAQKRPNSYDAAVHARTANIQSSDLTRLPEFDERERIQKKTFQLPLFPTTTIGSFPQTADVKANRKAFRTGKQSVQEYTDFCKSKISEWVKWQEEVDLDVLVHGEFERNDMVEYFGERLNGYLFTEKAWVQSYGTRCVKPPIIWGDVSRAGSMTVDWSVYAQSLTKKPMKGMLTGPVTILNWSFPREDISVKESTYQIAFAIRDEVLDLEAHGIRIIQVDEAALREKLPLRKSDWYTNYLDWAIPAFRLVHSGVKPETQIHTHMCYSEFTDIIPAIDSMDADVITFEASRSNLDILDSLKSNDFRTEVGPGVYDIHSPRVPSIEEIHTALEQMLLRIQPHKLWVNPDCGLKTRGVSETKANLEHLVQAAKQLRKEHT